MSKVAGRRHRQQSALLRAPALRASQSVMRVAGVRGENLYELEAGDGSVALYSLPSRLRHVVFIRPGSYVVAEADDARAAKSKVRGDIDAVVLDVHLAEMRKLPQWPARFRGPHSPGRVCGGGRGEGGSGEVEGVGEGMAREGEVGADVLLEEGAEESSSESELEENPNRRKFDAYVDEDSDE